MTASTSKSSSKISDTWKSQLAPIEITYRDEGNGKGPFYDHYTIQRALLRPTQILIPANQTTSALVSYIKTETTTNLFFGIPTAEGKIIPKVSSPDDQAGLLIIPGHAREMEKKRAADLALRNIFEQNVLRDALRRGRPIVGICGGASQLWNLINVIVRFNQQIHELSDPTALPRFQGSIPAKGHAWEHMPSINRDGSIGHNVAMHKIVIPATSMLSTTSTRGWQLYKSTHKITEETTKIPLVPKIHPQVEIVVNSVHWEAPAAAYLPQTREYCPPKNPPQISPDQLKISSFPQFRNVLEVNALSMYDETVGPANRNPEGNVIEGFELAHGAPLLGIVWHPEAHNPDGSAASIFNKGLLQYMAKAGDAYAAKVRMLVSLRQDPEIEQLSARLRHVSIKDTSQKESCSTSKTPK